MAEGPNTLQEGRTVEWVTGRRSTPESPIRKAVTKNKTVIMRTKRIITILARSKVPKDSSTVLSEPLEEQLQSPLGQRPVGGKPGVLIGQGHERIVHVKGRLVMKPGSPVPRARDPTPDALATGKVESHAPGIGLQGIENYSGLARAAWEGSDRVVTRHARLRDECRHA